MTMKAYWFTVILVIVVFTTALANPSSKPYVPFRTDPRDQKVHHNLTFTTNIQRSNVHKISTPNNNQCPLQFTLGISKRSHHSESSSEALSLNNAPVIYPVHPARGPGRQVVYTTQYEHLDLLTPASPSQMMGFVGPSSVIKEGLVQQEDFPLLFESSSFHASPILHDVNGDGIVDAILVDYDGGIYVVGLHAKKGERRFFHRAQIPRIHVRRNWMEARLNQTLNETSVDNRNDPFHSYFEYSGTSSDSKILRGVTAHLLGQEHDHVKGLEQRRKRKVHHKRQEDGDGGDASSGNQETEQHDNEHNEFHDNHGEAVIHRRLQQEDTNTGDDAKDGDTGEEDLMDAHDDAFMAEHMTGEHNMEDPHEASGDPDDDDDEWERVRGGERPAWGDDDLGAANHDYSEDMEDDALDRDYLEEMEREDMFHGGDDYRAMYDDMFDRHDYDDYYRSSDRGFYEEKHYIRIPPHVLCDPILVEMPKPYVNSNEEKDDMLIMAVSYYLDEDEYEGHFSYKRFENTDRGDETEMSRGMYVTNALMFYKFNGGSGSWGRQEQLDLSGDFSAPQNASLVASLPFVADETTMGAFALASPTVADVDGDGSLDLLLGTSMGLVYQFDAQHLYNREGWPVQMKRPVESRILVEDVRDDTNLEIFVADIGGNIVCLDAKGITLWHRDLLGSIGLTAEQKMVGSSPMVLGDVNGDGVLDLVVVLCVGDPTKENYFVFALSAESGNDIANFPISIESPPKKRDFGHQKLLQPLLVDLHAEQSHWKSYLQRNGTKQWNSDKSGKAPMSPPHGGSSPGIHIIQPIGSDLYVIEGGSGCTQTVDIGDEVTSMVQADDVHGTNSLDLVVSTASGNIVTLESPVVPFHPLNVWNNGEGRGRGNSVAHGFTASQGIFVRDVSRQYRDIFGIYVPTTFEIFDNRPNMRNEEAKRKYVVEMRDGTSSKRVVMRKVYTEPGVYTERVYIPYGPGYYTFTVLLQTSHGLVYEDRFHLGYNVHFMEGFGMLLWLPLIVAAVPILLCGRKKLNWDDEDFDRDERGGRGMGILGRSFS